MNNNIPKDKKIKRIESAKFTNKNKNYNNIINIEKNNYINKEHNQENKYMEFDIKNLLKDEQKKGIHFSHDKNLLYIKNNLKNVETDFKQFLNKLINTAGIILIFKEENIHKIKEQINYINSLKEKIENYTIFPTNSNSKEGMVFSLGLTCISFPSYIFCKYKNDSIIYITDRMEGGFDKSFLEKSVYKIISTLNPIDNRDINKLNMKEKLKENRQSNSKDKEIFDNIYHQFRKKEPVDKRMLDNKNKNKNNNNINEQKIPRPIKTNINNYKKGYPKNEININNIPYKENVIDNNNINIIQNNHINNNNYQNNNNINDFINKIDNFGDFFLGNSIDIPKLFGNYNDNNSNSNNNNQKQDKIIENSQNNKINNENDMMLRDSIYNLSDGQVLAKREQEMRRLEKMQEEKEREEKEKQKKIEEEKLKIKKYEKEAEIAKMILVPEPDDNNPDTCHIKFRLPDGEKIVERKFLKTDKISALYDYVKSVGREIFMEPDAIDFNIISIGFPPKNLENLKNSTLEKEGLYPNSILQIEEK